jgi:hypothetical protein
MVANASGILRLEKKTFTVPAKKIALRGKKTPILK